MRLPVAALALVLGFSDPLAADIAVVVGPESPIRELDGRQVANIFLSKTNRFEDGSRAEPVELSDTDLKSRFYQLISGKTLSQINSYWTTLIFTGRGKPPASHESPAEIVQLLMSDPHAISYLPQDGIPEELRVVYRPR